MRSPIRWSTLLASAVLGVMAPVDVGAQICEGLPSLREHPLVVGANYSRSDPDWAVGGNVTWGRAAFVSLAGGYARYPGFNFGLPQPGSAHSAVVHLGGGYEMPVRPARAGGGSGPTVAICPAAYVEYETGPDGDYSGVRADASALTMGAGAGIGAVVVARGSVRVIPYLGLAFIRAHAGRITMASGGVRSVHREGNTEYGGLIDFGVGIVLGTLTLGPAVTFPIGFEDADVSYGVGVSVSLGTGRR